MGARAKKTVYWLEHLGIWEVLIFSVRAVFCRIKVNYDENKDSPLAVKLLVLFKGRLFYPAHLTLDKKDKSGYALNYRMEKILDECSDDFCSRYLAGEAEYFKRMVKSFISSQRFYRVTFLTMVKATPEFIENKDVNHNIIYLVKNPLNKTFLNFYRKSGYSLKESLFSFEYCKYYVRPLYLLMRILFSRFFSADRITTNISQPRPAIWIEYSHDAIVDYAFWRHYANKANDFDIVYYITNKDKKTAVQARAKVEAHGMKYIGLDFNSLLKLTAPGFGVASRLIKAFFEGRPGSPLWLAVFRFEYRMWYELYLRVFKRFKVKVLIQHEEFSWVQQPQKEAVESAGGIMVGFHWSSFPYFRAPFHLTPQHVFFVWGGINRECMVKNGSPARYILPSGVWITNDTNGGCSREFFSKRPAFVLAIFDSSVGYNFYVSPASLQQFYLRIIKLLENNKEWGGIIKSKNWALDDFMLLPGGEEVISRIKTLINDRRVVMLDKRVSPVVASAYADLSVCYSVNSAGIIAGAHGYRAIHWDSSGWLHHPLYKEKGQKVLFGDLDEFERMIVEASKGNTAIGDFSAWRGAFNHFKDAGAAGRIGRFIDTFMSKAAVRGQEHALCDSVNEYIAENKVAEDFFKDTDWWGNSA